MQKIFVTAGERIAELRGDLSQAQFAERLGVNRLTVVRWEAGERLPDGASLMALMTEFGADVNYILKGARSQDDASPAPLSAGDLTLLDNFHAAPPGVQAGVKTTLGAFAPGASAASSASPTRKRRA